ncbi:MAG: FliA/WhiG family RNA polymerase sigma factor [Gemmatimonadaceae bacterium]|nr:FliA/WhiG family RNA polymerase sigma factor [Gemmatimonadaceae bacterium]
MPTATAPSRASRAIDARNELVQAHVGLVHFLARRLHSSLADEAELDELVSAGLVGLMRAAESFDRSRGLAFTTYATPRVRGAMLDELRRLDRVPRSVRARARQMQAVHNMLAHRLGRQPDSEEMAAALGVDVETYFGWEDDVRGGTMLTLDDHGSEASSAGSALRDRIPVPDFDLDVELDREIERERVRDALESLSVDEQRVLALSYFEELTLQEIAPLLGITESGASRMRTRALRRLREALGARLAA